MIKRNAFLLLAAITAIYIWVIWIIEYFGPGATLMFSVVYLILFIYLVSSLLSKKK